MRMLMLILSIVVLCWNAVAQERSCTKTEAMEAERSVSRLNNWEDIYKSFKKFRHCDDGAIAEGYSNSVVRMLARRWNRLEELIKLASTDKEFFAFVVRHIDATADKIELNMIIVNTSKDCPESATIMCSTIESAARKAIRELQKCGK
jgi:hypothetical protein